jgi:hypothetical protein
MNPGLFSENDRTVIFEMAFDEAVPLLMLMLDIGEDEAFDMWKQNQEVPPETIRGLAAGGNP